MSPSHGSGRPPAPIIAIHVLAAIGVLFWISMVVQAFTSGSGNTWGVVALAVILGGAHVLIWVLASRHSARVTWPMWFVLIGDSLLTLFVDLKAILLVSAAIVLLILTRPASARAWLTAR